MQGAYKEAPMFTEAGLVPADNRSELVPLRLWDRLQWDAAPGQTAQREVCSHQLSLWDVTST